MNDNKIQEQKDNVKLVRETVMKALFNKGFLIKNYSYYNDKLVNSRRLKWYDISCQKNFSDDELYNIKQYIISELNRVGATIDLSNTGFKKVKCNRYSVTYLAFVVNIPNTEEFKRSSQPNVTLIKETVKNLLLREGWLTFPYQYYNDLGKKNRRLKWCNGRFVPILSKTESSRIHNVIVNELDKLGAVYDKTKTGFQNDVFCVYIKNEDYVRPIKQKPLLKPHQIEFRKKVEESIKSQQNPLMKDHPIKYIETDQDTTERPYQLDIGDLIKSQLKEQNESRFVEAKEYPLPNYVWIIDTKTNNAMKVSLCDLHGVRKFIKFLGECDE